MSPGQNTLKKYWRDIFVSILSLRRSFRVRHVRLCAMSWATPIGDCVDWRFLVGGWFMLEREVDVGRGRFILGTDLHLFQTRFVIGWENNRDVDITMPLSLKTIGSAGYKDQWNKKVWCVQVNRMLKRGRFMLEGRVHLRGEGTAKESL